VLALARAAPAWDPRNPALDLEASYLISEGQPDLEGDTRISTGNPDLEGDT